MDDKIIAKYEDDTELDAILNEIPMDEKEQLLINLAELSIKLDSREKSMREKIERNIRDDR